MQRAIKDVAIQNEQALYKQCVDQPTAVRAGRGCFQQTNATKRGGCNTDRRHYNAPQSRRKQLRDSSTSLHARKLANHTCTTSPPRTPLQFVVWRCTGKGQRLVLADQSQLMTSRDLERCWQPCPWPCLCFRCPPLPLVHVNFPVVEPSHSPLLGHSCTPLLSLQS